MSFAFTLAVLSREMLLYQLLSVVGPLLPCLPLSNYCCWLALAVCWGSHISCCSSLSVSFKELFIHRFFFTLLLVSQGLKFLNQLKKAFFTEILDYFRIIIILTQITKYFYFIKYTKIMSLWFVSMYKKKLILCINELYIKNTKWFIYYKIFLCLILRWE